MNDRELELALASIMDDVDAPSPIGDTLAHTIDQVAANEEAATVPMDVEQPTSAPLAEQTDPSSESDSETIIDEDPAECSIMEVTPPISPELTGPPKTPEVHLDNLMEQVQGTAENAHDTSILSSLSSLPSVPRTPGRGLEESLMHSTPRKRLRSRDIDIAPTEPQPETRRSTSSTSRSRVREEDRLHKVKAIVGHRRRRGPNRKMTIEYEVEWEESDGHQYFLPAEELGNCFNLVTKYLSSIGQLGATNFPLPPMIRNSGADCLPDGKYVNANNLADIGKVLNVLSHFRNMDTYKPFPEILTVNSLEKQWQSKLLQELEQAKDSKVIIISQLHIHLYVSMFDQKKNILFLADGSNAVINEPNDKELNQHFLAIQLMGQSIFDVEFEQARLKYPAQKIVDQCATSAAMIALSFIKHEKQGTWPANQGVINNIPKATMDHVTRQINPHDGDRIQSGSHIKDNMESVKKNFIVKCRAEKCPKTFDSRNSNKVRMHELTCKLLKSEQNL